MLVHPAIRLVSPPVWIEYLVHPRRMQPRPFAEVCVTHRRRNDVLIEIGDTRLLLLAQIPHPDIVLLAEHFGTDLVEDIRIPGRKRSVPGLGPASRDHHET